MNIIYRILLPLLALFCLGCTANQENNNTPRTYNTTVNTVNKHIDDAIKEIELYERDRGSDASLGGVRKRLLACQQELKNQENVTNLEKEVAAIKQTISWALKGAIYLEIEGDKNNPIYQKILSIFKEKFPEINIEMGKTENISSDPNLIIIEIRKQENMIAFPQARSEKYNKIKLEKFVPWNW